MKKIILFFSVCYMSCILSLQVFAMNIAVSPTSKLEVYVDEQKFALTSYNIGGNSYFKLRDIAYILNGTEKQFQVKWDGIHNKVQIVTGEAYTSVGAELVDINYYEVQKTVLGITDIYINDCKTTFQTYNINGYTFFRLRDLGTAMNFQVNMNKGKVLISPKKQSAITPWEYQKILGKGIDVDWSGNNRGKKFYNEKVVSDFKEAGVSHVRIRIIDDATEELLRGLDKQIEDCLKNGIVPIIAYHASDFERGVSEETMDKVIEWWKIVAEHYKDISPLVSFDLIIEVSDKLNKEPDLLNEFYEKAVTEIRKTNPTRIIMISPRLRSDASYLHELKIPTQHNNYLMAEWHFYASGPSKLNERKLWTTGTEAEKALITEKINLALQWQEKTGIPTWVGAWMPGNYNEGNDYRIPEQVIFAEYMSQSLDKANIPFAVNSDTKFYNRETNEWIQEMLPVFNTIYVKK